MDLSSKLFQFTKIINKNKSKKTLILKILKKRLVNHFNSFHFIFPVMLIRKSKRNLTFLRFRPTRLRIIIEPLNLF